MIARAYGAAETCLVDVGRFARLDLELYRRLALVLRAKGLEPIDVDGVANIEALLDACGGTYLTNGLASLALLSDERFDYVWSNAVLEHIDRAEFDQTLGELARVMTRNGVSSHRVDLQDHLSGSLNNLRFGDSLWESSLFKGSGFYTNRFRSSEIMDAFDKANLRAVITSTESWPSLPIARSRLAERFRTVSDEDLRVRWIDVRVERHRDRQDTGALLASSGRAE
jgi:hypothetical protein